MKVFKQWSNLAVDYFGARQLSPIKADSMVPSIVRSDTYRRQGCGTEKFEDGSGSDILSEYGSGSGSGPGSGSGSSSGSCKYIYIYEYVYIYVYIFANVYVYTY